ncbi:MAG: ferritin-like domain-containing protein [Inquilinus sp.]|nr:ferritin-like domain-containing protein [Inquilinus sp.]
MGNRYQTAADSADTLTNAAIAVLTTADAADKARLSRSHAAAWHDGRIAALGRDEPPSRPGRPVHPELKPPRDMPKRRKAGSVAGRIALLHALAHIELNAVDLAWDVVARFARAAEENGDVAHALPRAFFDDWVDVADEEGKHFLLLADRLAALGAAYGDLPAHDGLWEASIETAHDLAARLAVVPLVLEARGLDVTPAMIDSLKSAGDPESAAILQIIHDDEIGHVTVGRRWFEHVCARRGVEPIPTWQALVRRHFKGALKRPFNTASRDRAGFAAALYEPLAD